MSPEATLVPCPHHTHTTHSPHCWGRACNFNNREKGILIPGHTCTRGAAAGPVVCLHFPLGSCGKGRGLTLLSILQWSHLGQTLSPAKLPFPQTAAARYPRHLTQGLQPKRDRNRDGETGHCQGHWLLQPRKFEASPALSPPTPPSSPSNQQPVVQGCHSHSSLSSARPLSSRDR